MNRKTVIILEVPESDPECWGNLKKLCFAKGFPYHTLKKMKMPIDHGDYKIYRVPFN